MALTPRQLLRLYPGLWRLRYGGEFLALLETTPITRAVVIDVVRSAAREWVTRTRIGQLLLGSVVAFAATPCAVGLTRVVSSVTLLGEPGLDSFESLVYRVLVRSTTLIVGTFLIVAKTCHDRRFEGLGLSRFVAVFFLTAAWDQWAVLGYSSGAAVDLDGVWMQSAFSVSFMLVLLLNVDRRHETFFSWRALSRWTSSDRY